MNKSINGSAAAEYRRQWAENTNVPYGDCWCGCGEATRLATQTRRRGGWVAGEPLRYRPGHNTRRLGDEYRVEDRGHDTSCWIWLGAKGKSKLGIYGVKRVAGQYMRAHRAYYEQAYGPLPHDKVLHHECDVPLCVRPSHCTPMTQSDHARGHAERLTDAERDEMIRLYRATRMTGREIGQRFGVVQSYVSYLATQHGVRREKSWQHVNTRK